VYSGESKPPPRTQTHYDARHNHDVPNIGGIEQTTAVEKERGSFTRTENSDMKWRDAFFNVASPSGGGLF
jgi:hypothetical protein